MSDEAKVSAGMLMFIGFSSNSWVDYLSEVWYPVTQKDLEAETVDYENSKEISFKHKRGRRLTLGIGAVYKTEHEGTTVRWLSPTPIAYWPNQVDKEKWFIRSEAARKDFEARQRLEKEGDKHYMKSRLEPVRELYRSMTSPQKAQLIADMVRYVSS